MKRSAVVLVVLAASHAAAAPQFGAEEWLPSPTDPVGFAGQGGNWYPGATPPVEFWEGTPTTVNVPHRETRSKFNAPFEKEKTVPGYADARSKNILWKVETPGWSTSTPVPVGKRVITLHSPHYVVCRDTDTGQVVWQDELKVMTLPKLAKDRKSLEPVAADAAKLQRLHEMAVAAYRVARGCQPSLGGSRMTGQTLQTLTNYHVAFLAGWTEFRKQVETEFPEGVAAVDKDIALVQKILGLAKTGAAEAPGAVANAFTTWAMKQTGVHVGNCWPGFWISDTIATPVSDGEIVAVQFGHGQTAAYELATGKRLWAFRDPTVNAGSVSHAPSPLLWRDLVIFNAGGGPSAGGGAMRPSLLAVDKRTGQPRWEVPIPDGCAMGTSHGDHMPHCLVRLPGGKAVVASNRGQIVDIESGKVLIAPLPTTVSRPDWWGSGYLCSLGSRLYKTVASDAFGPPMERWDLELADGKLTARALPAFPSARASQSAFVVSDRLLVTPRKGVKLVDPQTGAVFDTIPEARQACLAGNTLICPLDNGPDPRGRQDRFNLLEVTTYDVSDPTTAQLLARRSLLGNAAMPRDILDTYFPNIGNNPDLKDYLLGGYHGLAAGFGVYMCGIPAQGNRLFILSQTHLYCVGPEVLGSPQDDPAVVERIAAADAGTLGTFLDGERPRYRHEALRRMATLKVPAGKRVVELMEKDTFEEIRAAAVLALDAAGENGGEQFLSRYLATQKSLAQTNDDTDVIGPYLLTARALGADYFPARLAKAMATEKDAGMKGFVHRQALVTLAARLGLFTPEVTAGAIAVAQFKTPLSGLNARRLPNVFDYLGRAAASDPVAMAALRQVQPALLHLAVAALANRLPEDQLPAYLDEVLRSGGNLGYDWGKDDNRPIVRICDRLGAGKAVPILEKVAADKPNLAKTLQALITQQNRIEAQKTSR